MNTMRIDVQLVWAGVSVEGYKTDTKNASKGGYINFGYSSFHAFAQFAVFIIEKRTKAGFRSMNASNDKEIYSQTRLNR